ncbi:hypothetical protein [Staphylococcus delphini]|uniref:hypothetical protein n=1 Tax=Staphylococcus delphini TaxID=53344 RepID=UPI000BBCBC42|nr:hypothetical protein [Staphylococcus delphini]PCF82994.1 hypothetical protein B4W69_10905 [Staphylococcus delphini]
MYESEFLMSPFLIEHRPLHNGEQYFFSTSYNYLLSIVRHCDSYGIEDGLYEMAKVSLARDEIIGDVLGWLTVEDVLKHVKNANLKKLR